MSSIVRRVISSVLVFPLLLDPAFAQAIQQGSPAGSGRRLISSESLCAAQALSAEAIVGLRFVQLLARTPRFRLLHAESRRTRAQRSSGNAARVIRALLAGLLSAAHAFPSALREIPRADDNPLSGIRISDDEILKLLYILSGLVFVVYYRQILGFLVATPYEKIRGALAGLRLRPIQAPGIAAYDPFPDAIPSLSSVDAMINRLAVQSQNLRGKLLKRPYRMENVERQIRDFLGANLSYNKLFLLYLRLSQVKAETPASSISDIETRNALIDDIIDRTVILLSHVRVPRENVRQERLESAARHADYFRERLGRWLRAVEPTIQEKQIRFAIQAVGDQPYFMRVEVLNPPGSLTPELFADWIQNGLEIPEELKILRPPALFRHERTGQWVLGAVFAESQFEHGPTIGSRVYLRTFVNSLVDRLRRFWPREAERRALALAA